jgi:hypothetical protein
MMAGSRKDDEEVNMRDNPYKSPTKSSMSRLLNPKYPYLVTIDGQEFHTSAHSPQAAISNAAYRYSEQEEEEVALVRWKIREGHLNCEVEEV